MDTYGIWEYWKNESVQTESIRISSFSSPISSFRLMRLVRFDAVKVVVFKGRIQSILKDRREFSGSLLKKENLLTARRTHPFAACFPE